MQQPSRKGRSGVRLSTVEGKERQRNFLEKKFRKALDRLALDNYNSTIS